MFYIINYDLNQSGQRYDSLIKAIRTFPCIHIMQSVWFIKSSKSAGELYSLFSIHLDNNDRIFIEEINTNGAGQISQAGWDFLNS